MLKSQVSSELEHSADGLEAPKFVRQVERLEGVWKRRVPTGHTLNGRFEIQKALALHTVGQLLCINSYVSYYETRVMYEYTRNYSSIGERRDMWNYSYKSKTILTCAIRNAHIWKEWKLLNVS